MPAESADSSPQAESNGREPSESQRLAEIEARGYAAAISSRTSQTQPEKSRNKPQRKDEAKHKPDSDSEIDTGSDSDAESDADSDADAAEHRSPDEKAKQPSKPFYKRPLLMTVIIVVAVVVIVGGIVYWLWARQFESTDDAFIDGNVVQMQPKVTGYVVAMHFTDNELVTAGQLLIEIDPRDYQAALDSAAAASAAAAGRLAEADAQLTGAESQVAASRANVAAAVANAQNAQKDLARYQALTPTGAASRQSLDAAIATAQSTAAQETAARATTNSSAAQASLARAHKVTAAADMAQARAQLAEAKLNLSYAKIRAPITGRVTQRTVDLGDYLAPGQPMFALVDPNVWVTANFKETQLTNMHVGQHVRVHIDAFPSRYLDAHVDSFQRGTGARFSILPAENATGNFVKVVQRVPVKILFDQPVPQDMMLGPGMSVEPRITIR